MMLRLVTYEEVNMRNIASERVRLGLTQEGLAEHLGVARQTVLRWENGKTNPPTSAIYMMAYLFGCSTDYLVGRTDERN